MKSSSLVLSILELLVLSVAVANEVTEPFCGDAGSAAEQEVSLRGLSEIDWKDVKDGAPIKLRFDTFKCLAVASPGGNAKFEECKDRVNARYQFWELKRSYLISSYLYWKDDEEWCLTYVPNSNSLTLALCQLGNNRQRWRYDGFNHFRSFYGGNGMCLEHSDGKALLEECDDFKDDQAFLFRYF